MDYALAVDLETPNLDTSNFLQVFFSLGFSFSTPLRGQK